MLVVIAVPLYLAAALRCFLLYRRRRSVVLLSILTADVLLAEAMVAVALGANWHLTWWLWHVLMVVAFGYVGYSAYVTYRREGATRGCSTPSAPRPPCARCEWSTDRRWSSSSRRSHGRRRAS